MPRKTRRQRKYKRTKRHTRRRQRGGSANKTVDLVIARYKEPVSWLDKYKDRDFSNVHIYSKSDKPISPPSFKNKSTKFHIKEINNVGVCDHTYLYHIVNNWDNLAPVTIFLPGSADMAHKVPLTNFTIDKALETKNTVLNVYPFDIGVGEAMYNFTMEAYPTGHSDNQDEYGESPQALAEIRPFGAWYAANFPGEQPKEASFFGIFALSRDHIHRRPKSFFENLLRQVNTHKFHEASHFIERAYPAMIHPAPPECMFRSNIIDRVVEVNSNGYTYLRRISGGGDLKFAVLGIFKNEAMGIREWVDHYKWQGVDEILLLDNNSTDGGADLVKGLKHVTVIHAPKVSSQAENYNELGLPWLRQNGIDIVSILDLDEFMFGTDGKNLKQHVLEMFGGENAPSQFSCPWTMFGSSDEAGNSTVEQPPSIRKGFVWRKKDLTEYPNVKTIFRLKDLKDNGLNQHHSDVTGATVPCPPGIQLNHYAIQSQKYFEKVKMTRGDVSALHLNSIRDWNYFKNYDFKDQKDTQLKDLVEAAEAAAPQ